MDNKITSILQDIDDAKRAIFDAQSAADRAATYADDALTFIYDLQDKVGKANGIAPLDVSSRVPLNNLPGRVDNVVEFYVFVEGVEISEGMSHHYSGDEGCIVVYDKSKQCFLLGQLKMGQAESEVATASDSGSGSSVTPGGNADPGGKVDPENPWIVDMIDLSKYNFFRSWMDCVSYGTYSINGRKPQGGKIYICHIEGKLYWWNGLSLVLAGGASSSDGSGTSTDNITPLTRAELDRMIDEVKTTIS